MRDRLSGALAKSTADYTDIRFENQDSTSLGYRGKEVEHVSTDKFIGGIVRACTKGGWGIAVFDSLDDLERKVEEACSYAALVGKETTQLADADSPTDAVVRAELTHDFRGVSIDEKLSVITRYNDIITGFDPSIESSSVSYSDTFRTVYFASSRGAYYMEERPRVVLRVCATARDGSLVQSAGEGEASTTTYDVVLGKEELAEKIAKRAVDLLKAPPVEGGQYDVVLDRKLAGVFAHEAFGHLSEADFLYENPKMKELMHIGREMGVKELSIIDDSSMTPHEGTQWYDDEGTPTRKTYLIRDGVLSGHLHSLETAAKMGEEPTGNARSIRRDCPPIVRMTNTYIENGTRSFDELISGIENGIFACDMQGGQTMLEMFTFSAGYAYRIKNGKIGEMVRDVVLTGNVFETLHSIDGIGNDLQIFDGPGGCGKGGQSPLPVSFGSPHIRIRNVLVGGV